MEEFNEFEKEITNSNNEKITKEQIYSEENKESITGIFNKIAETKLSNLYKDWWLDYASYVILERAVPHIDDGLKPVQRRILYSLKRMDDGRYHKVANIIGHTMQFHPHGDASIFEALVQLGQKQLLIDTQGNWGNIFTGDSAAAPRYIEARLSKFAKEVLFNDDITQFQQSYDGRNLEPVVLPVKFPILLHMGTEGIAVGLASKILPHNFCEIIDASINYLLGKDFTLYPDFPTGGLIDVSKYNDGLRGGSVKVRCKIKKIDNKTLVINDLPYGITTEKLIDSILKANEKGKIKIKKIDDNTSEKVEIIIHLPPGVSPDKTIDALYAFTLCEITIPVYSCVIKDNKPVFLSVKDILKYSVERIKGLLKNELECKLKDYNEELFFLLLEKIFIQNKIYRKIEDKENFDDIVSVVYNELLNYEYLLPRKITNDDILKLLELHIKKISKFNLIQAEEKIKDIQNQIQKIQDDLKNIVEYTINFFNYLKKTYGAKMQRKTEIRNFEEIDAQLVISSTKKLYVNRSEGFIGTSLKKDEFVCECSDIDDVLVILEDGTYFITKVADKLYVGNNIIHVSIYNKEDRKKIYNIIYIDGLTKFTFIKRCKIEKLLREKKYNITQGNRGSKVLWASASKIDEAEIVNVFLVPKKNLRKKVIEVNFADFIVKSKNVKGNLLSKNEAYKVLPKEKTKIDFEGLDIFYDKQVNRLSYDSGTLLGKFKDDDYILVITKTGKIVNYKPDINAHLEDDIIFIHKYYEKTISLIYKEKENNIYYVKRFVPKKTERILDIFENENYIVVSVSYADNLMVQVITKKGIYEIKLSDFVKVKSYSSKGKRIPYKNIKEVLFIEIENQNFDKLDGTTNNEINKNNLAIDSNNGKVIDS